jgi:hypothetical protein
MGKLVQYDKQLIISSDKLINYSNHVTLRP